MHNALHSAAPNVRTRSKVRHSDAWQQRALLRGAYVWRDTPFWIPVIARGRYVGDVKGDPARGGAWVRCSQDHPYVSYDDAVAFKSAGRHAGIYWFKMTSTSVVIDNWYDLWGVDGSPQLGGWSGTARTARRFDNTTTGALYNAGGSVSPLIKYLTRLLRFTQLSTVSSFILYDRVLSYDACTMTAGSQSMTNTLTITRYNDPGSQVNPGLQIFMEADTIHNATAANLTVLDYTDQDGNGPNLIPTTPTLSKVVSIAAPSNTLGARSVIQTPGNATKSGNPYLTLGNQATSSSGGAQQGVKAILDYTWSAAPTGTVSFVLQFPLALFVDSVTDGQASDNDFLFGIDVINKRIYDNACLSFLYCPHVTAEPGGMQGWLEVGW